jgi:hypothetical protein
VESSDEPDEYLVKQPDGTDVWMLSTASGHIPKDFSNTKIVQNGQVISISDLQTLNQANAPTMHQTNKELASFDQSGNLCLTGRSYATDIGLFKAGMG